MTLEETGKVLKVLYAVWPEKTITRDLVTAYHFGWEDLDYEQVNRAVGTWIKTGEFFPRPAQIRSLCFQMRELDDPYRVRYDQRALQ